MVTVTVASLALPAGAMVVPSQSVAAPSAGAPYVSVAHGRLADTRLKAGRVVSFVVLGRSGLPATGFSAVVLSVAVAAPAGAGALVAYPTGSRRPGVTSVSLVKGHASTSDVVVVPGAGGKVSVYNASKSTEHVLVAAVAYYAAPGNAKATNAATTFVGLPPRRVGSVVVGGTTSLTVLGKLGVPTQGVAAVVVTLTVGAPDRSGALVAYPVGAKAPRQGSLSFHAGRAVTAAVVVKPGTKGRIALANRSTRPVRVTVAVVGYLLTLRVPAVPSAAMAVAQSSSALVSWAPPTTDGGAPVTAYTVVASPSGASVTVDASSRSVVVAGLARRTPYTFAVSARNSRGSGPSAGTTAVTPFTVPGAPTSVTAATTAVGTVGQVAVSWTAPSDDGGAAVAGYRVTSAPGGVTATSATTSLAMSGLQSGVYYSFTVVALNAAGSSVASSASGLAVAAGLSLASVTATGGPTQGSDTASVSGNGRYVAYASSDDGLVPGDSNGVSDVFVRDRQTGTTTLVSVAMDGVHSGDKQSSFPSISDDGRYVAFSSDADNLVPGDTLGHEDVFVRDLTLQATRLLSAVNGLPGDSGSDFAKISGDGSAVAFTSSATNLVTPDANGLQDVFVVKLSTGAAQLVSASTTGSPGNGVSTYPAISHDGTVVAFASTASNLTTSPPTGGRQQVYVRQLLTGHTAMVSVASPAVAADLGSVEVAISGDGRHVAFVSNSTNLVPGVTGAVGKVFVADTVTGAVTLGSFGVGGVPPDSASLLPSLSTDGRFLSYQSSAQNLGYGPAATAQVVRADLLTDVNLLMSATPAGGPAPGVNGNAQVSADGQHVALSASALPGGNGQSQIYVQDLG